MTIDYQKYRGKCKEMSEALVKNNKNLRIVRGYYHCPIWGKQQHWWCENIHTKEIVDPSVKQFPTAGIAAEYEEFDGWLECSNCGKKIHENEASGEGSYAFCSDRCYGMFVGVL